MLRGSTAPCVMIWKAYKRHCTRLGGNEYRPASWPSGKRYPRLKPLSSHKQKAGHFAIQWPGFNKPRLLRYFFPRACFCRRATLGGCYSSGPLAAFSSPRGGGMTGVTVLGSSGALNVNVVETGSKLRVFEIGALNVDLCGSVGVTMLYWRESHTDIGHRRTESVSVHRASTAVTCAVTLLCVTSTWTCDPSRYLT